MGLDTKISWPDHTINPWVGCSRRCAYCYMYAGLRRTGRDPTKPTRLKEETFHLPTAKKRNGDWKLPGGSRVFVCSWSDFFDTEAPDAWRYEFFEEVKARPDVEFLFLTKSVENMVRFMRNVWARNVWLGVTVENQAAAERRLPYLARVSWPRFRFVSAEPLHGPLDLTPWASMLDWVIVGGQSGRTRVSMRPEWARSIQAQCRESSISFWFTKWGTWHPEGSLMRRGEAPPLLDGVLARAHPVAAY